MHEIKHPYLQMQEVKFNHLVMLSLVGE